MEFNRNVFIFYRLKSKCNSQILRSFCLIQHGVDGKIAGRIEVTIRRGRRRKQLLDDLNPLNTELNPICHLLTLLEAHHILHFSRIRVKERQGTGNFRFIFYQYMVVFRFNNVIYVFLL